MKFLFGTFLALVAAQVSSAAFIQVHKSFLTEEELKEVLNHQGDDESTILSNDIVRRLLIHSGLDEETKDNYAAAEPDNKPAAAVKTTKLDRTSDHHVDRYQKRGGLLRDVANDDLGASSGPIGTIVDDDVGFIMLNTNSKAAFHHGETKVPVMAGTFVKFAGNIGHHTQVNGGTVQLAGPFHMKTLEYVGCAGCLDPCNPSPPYLEACYDGQACPDSCPCDATTLTCTAAEVTECQTQLDAATEQGQLLFCKKRNSGEFVFKSRRERAAARLEGRGYEVISDCQVIYNFSGDGAANPTYCRLENE